MTIDFDEIRADVSAFADDDEEVIVERNGQCLFVRNGREVSFQVTQDEEGVLVVDVDGEQITYRRFLSHNLGGLPILAERIVSKRAPVPAYVDGLATRESVSSDLEEGHSLELLSKESSRRPAFLSRVVFITADAGQGKTALLRQFQHEQAQRFLAGESASLFWHVDLQGRQLLRLSEALMGDLADLRVSGLWMSAVVRLLRQGSLVLAIDGFDELAAEQGGSDALGALAVLVRQLGGRGSIVAASRRAFFDTEDYARRVRLFGRVGAADCEFNQIVLKEWSKDQAVAYLEAVEVAGNHFPDAQETYAAICAELGSPDHPMLTRPFLLTQVARGLLMFDVSPSAFIRGMDDPLQGVGAVIEAFVEREVADKWKQKDTGEPFLTRDQHLRLLSDVAEEMFRSQRSTIDVDVLETITTLLLDEWGIDPVRRQQIVQMVQMHVLLTPPQEGDYATRSFDHEEFRDWFTAYALKDRLLRLNQEGAAVSHDLLSVAHLPDATAKHVCALIDRTGEVTEDILAGLCTLVQREWRPTYLQMNSGTIVPFLLDGVTPPTGRFTVDGSFVFSSLVHEAKSLGHTTIRGAAFVNASLAAVHWNDVELVDCDLGEITVDRAAEYRDVVFRDCRLDGIRIVDSSGEAEESREYAPERMRLVLQGLGIHACDSLPDQAPEGEAVLKDGEMRKHVRRVLNLFRRTTSLPEHVVKSRFRTDGQYVLAEVLPLMQQFGIIEERQWKGAGRQHAWGLVVSLETLEKADGDRSHPIHAFWDEVDKRDDQTKR